MDDALGFTPAIGAGEDQFKARAPIGKGFKGGGNPVGVGAGDEASR